MLKGIVDRRERRAQIDARIEQTNLGAARNKAVGGFSGGMKQRLGIAIALLGKPRLLIVDEPTAGLDPPERRRFLNLLSDIGREVVVILSTHIVEDVAELCPNFAILAATPTTTRRRSDGPFAAGQLQTRPPCRARAGDPGGSPATG